VSAIVPVRTTTPLHPEAIAGASVSRAPGSVLPEPGAATPAGMQDAMSLLYTLIANLDNGVVAAASVVTFGAATAVAVVAMSVTGGVLKETGLGGSAGQWIGLGLSLGASAATLGSTAVTQAIAAGGLNQHQQLIEDMLDVMKQVHDSHKSALQSLQQAMQTSGESVAIAAQIGRA
jgi:hypothetical protein